MQLISGGQTGVDRAVLDVAVERGIAYGGWCPKGGWAEDFLSRRAIGEISAACGDPARRSGAAHGMERARRRRLHDRHRRRRSGCLGGNGAGARTCAPVPQAAFGGEPQRDGHSPTRGALAARPASAAWRRPETRDRRTARKRSAGNLCACCRTHPSAHGLTFSASPGCIARLRETVWP